MKKRRGHVNVNFGIHCGICSERYDLRRITRNNVDGCEAQAMGRLLECALPSPTLRASECNQNSSQKARKVLQTRFLWAHKKSSQVPLLLMEEKKQYNDTTWCILRLKNANIKLKKKQDFHQCVTDTLEILNCSNKHNKIRNKLFGNLIEALGVKSCIAYSLCKTFCGERGA